MPAATSPAARAKPDRALFRLLGPAFVAAVAYVDPGNVAANLSAGAKYGYLLVWVLVLANVMAILSLQRTSQLRFERVIIGLQAMIAIGFVSGGVNLAMLLRRLITLTPALVLLAAGVDPTSALVLSQVVFSFGIPLAIVPLIWFTSRREVMGEHVNPAWLKVVGIVTAILIVALNLVLLALTFSGRA